jgi:hypothetical protein
MLIALAEIVLEVIALVFKRVERRNKSANTAFVCLHPSAKRGPNRPQSLAGTGVCESGRPAFASVPHRLPSGTGSLAADALRR